MKRIILICPDQRPALEPVTGGVPLALAIYLGKPLIDHALDALVRAGTTHMRILASDRPADLRAYVGNGSAWGIEIAISPEPTELSPADAAIRHESFAPDAILSLDSLPQAPDVPILTDVGAWQESRRHLLPLLAPRQIGARETAPGVWCGLKARVDSSATLVPPCWIGHNSMVRAGAVVGPGAFVESDSLVDARATVEDSTVGTRTYLGSMTHLKDSIAAGPLLVNWRSGSQTRLADAFLLSRLDPPHEAASPLFARIAALVAIILTFPIALIAAPLALLVGRPWRVGGTAVLPSGAGEPVRSVTYHEIPALPGHLRRWPFLWRIVTGHFAWTGNPPLTPEEAAGLDSEFERLWLQAAPAIFTAPEAEGCSTPWDDAARSHAALFACLPTSAWRRRILARGLTRLFF